MKSLLLMSFLISCAHRVNQESDPLQTNTYNTESVISLVKNSYIKGCIDGKNDIYSIKTKGRRLKRCRDLSINHENDIRELLTQKIKTQSQ